MSTFERSVADGIARGAGAVLAIPETRQNQPRGAESRAAELAGLAQAIGLNIADSAVYRLRAARPATLFGAGQVDDIAARAAALEAELVVVDASLSPVQQRNLESATKTKVIDRTGLILEIFGERAATAEGRLQVELAHLDYQAGRLVRSWTHLERQRGGFGFLGGPGETQIEADRRLIRERMAKIRRELEQVKRTRGLHRARRQRAPWPVVALVGYTNAGKSTLFNRLTGADVLAQDMLFATLDPTMRQIALPGAGKVILSDTVGFVSDLPTQLVAAFRATLEEVVSADLILHVRDIAHPDSEAQAEDVRKVLTDIGALREGGAPLIEIWNKADLLGEEEHAALMARAARRNDVIALSALTGKGIDNLRDFLGTALTTAHGAHDLTIEAANGAARAWLHAHGKVEGEAELPGGRLRISVRLSPADHARFEERFGG